jgi:hypothetical protein
MSVRELYPSDITELEYQAGFKVMPIANPHRHFAYSRPTIDAVVYPLDQSHRLIKMRDPLLGDVSYKLQRYGKSSNSKEWEKADWLPVGDTADQDPCIAIDNASARIARASMSSQFDLEVPPPVVADEGPEPDGG